MQLRSITCFGVVYNMDLFALCVCVCSARVCVCMHEQCIHSTLCICERQYAICNVTRGPNAARVARANGWNPRIFFFCSLYFLVHLCIVHDIVMGCGDGDRERWLNIGGKCVYIYLATNDSAQNMPFSQMRVCHPYHHLRGHRLFLSIRDSLHRCICIFVYMLYACVIYAICAEAFSFRCVSTLDVFVFRICVFIVHKNIYSAQQTACWTPAQCSPRVRIYICAMWPDIEYIYMCIWCTSTWDHKRKSAMVVATIDRNGV